MSNPEKHTSHKLKTPLFSREWLKYLGIVGAALTVYILVMFYYHYSDDIFSKSLSVGQHIRLAALCIGSQLHFVLFALLLFSCGLLYRSVRRHGLDPLKAVKRDLVIILPLGIILWIFGAFYDAPVKGKFYSMIFDVQQLEPGQKLNDESPTFELLKEPNLSGIYEKITTLDAQIEEAENRFADQLAVLAPPAKLKEIIQTVDFGECSIELEDVQRSSYNWDGIERDIDFFEEQARSRAYYFDSLKSQQDRFQNEINAIHLTPIYVLLFMLLGMLLGYLIPLHRAALLAILFVVGYGWYFCFGILEAYYMTFTNHSWFILGKIGVLVLLNVGLLLIARRVYQRSKSPL